ncbi:MAG TPA: HAMP domain-containing histidine kinase [Candidatus Pelethocola excrementipullorum]|nr:HAMP domain-containing histidine kinase [Candidatus Pelethocola excrementipullorum]
MKLKTRIIISFFSIIFIPVILTCVMFYTGMKLKVEAIGKQYGIEAPTYQSLVNNTLMLNKMTENDMEELREAAENFPEKLESQEFLDALNEQLSGDFSYLVVREGNQIYYNGGTDKSNAKKLLKALPEYGDPRAASDNSVYMRSEEQTLVRQVDFKFQNGVEGSAFIITQADRVLPQVQSLMNEMLIVIVLILVGTSLVMSLWIYRGVVTPLNQLKKATQNIKEGNLDFTVEASGAREVKDLCEDFEEMRVRLRENAEEKVIYDSDNKELISNISHDLKTPITAVKGYVEGIMDGVADTPEKMDKYIRTIYNKANEMDRLINELTFYSKIDTNRIPYTFSKIHVSEYFEDCVEELNLELESQGIDLAYFNYLEEDTVIIADAEQLKRVINNVISNSIKYMNKARGIINIRLRDVGDFIQVEIEDNGKGIAQKDLIKVFDRFYRTDTSRNSTKGGSGIGLSIVKKILEDHGGKVWATSKEGVGTVMYFVLRKYQEVPINE